MSLRDFLSNLKPFLPDARDLHLHGGALLVSGGLWFYHWHWSVMAMGAFLVLLGRPWK